MLGIVQAVGSRLPSKLSSDSHSDNWLWEQCQQHYFRRVGRKVILFHTFARLWIQFMDNIIRLVISTEVLISLGQSSPPLLSVEMTLLLIPALGGTLVKNTSFCTCTEQLHPCRIWSWVELGFYVRKAARATKKRLWRCLGVAVSEMWGWFFPLAEDRDPPALDPDLFWESVFPGSLNWGFQHILLSHCVPSSPKVGEEIKW